MNRESSKTASILFRMVWFLQAFNQNIMPKVDPLFGGTKALVYDFYDMNMIMER